MGGLRFSWAFLGTAPGLYLTTESTSVFCFAVGFLASSKPCHGLVANRSIRRSEPILCGQLSANKVLAHFSSASMRRFFALLRGQQSPCPATSRAALSMLV